MWEFLTRKKEAAPAPVAEPVADTENSTGVGAVEQVSEQGSESAAEKYAAILTQSAGNTATAVDDGVVASDADQVAKAADAASRVNQLVELAQVKGVAHAVAVARRMNDFYVLDTMHDELADKLYEALKAKGLIAGE